MNQVDAIELRPGYRISTIIRGCSSKDGPYYSMNSAAALADMTVFLEAGITTIDCSDADPATEHLVGAFLQDLRKTHGRSATQAVHVHTRYLPEFSTPGSFSQSQIEHAIDQTLTRLDVDILDLVQLHWPNDHTHGCLDVLGHLSLMKAKGKLRQIGVCDLKTDHLETFLQSGVDIVSAQVPFSLIDQRPKDKYATLCRHHNIALMAYGTLAGGFLSPRWLGAPDPGYRFEAPSLARYRLVIEAFGGWSLFQELLMALSTIADRHGVSLSSVALRAIQDHADTKAVVLHSSSAAQLPEHLKASNFTPTQRDRETLTSVLSKRKGPLGPVSDPDKFQINQDHGYYLRKNPA